MKSTKIISLKYAGFSLVEMLVAMTIFFIVVSATYIPYSYYQNKQYVKNAGKDISQLLYESRSMAINGQSTASGNVSLWVYFDAQSSNNNVSVFTYPYTFTGAQIIPQITADIKLLKKMNLEWWAQIDSIGTYKKFLFFYSAITWEGTYVYWDTSGTRWELITQEIPIILSYKGATTANFQKILKYYTYTHIIDY